MTKAKLLDLIYAKVDDLMRSGSLIELDKMFVFSKETDLDLMVGLLTASLPVKSKLHARPAYYHAVADLCRDLGETDPTILQGLA